MRDTQSADAERNATDDQPRFVNYLPGMPRISSSPGRVERFVTHLFRRRGGLRVVLRRRD